MKQIPIIKIPSTEDLRLLAQSLHNQLVADAQIEDLVTIDGLVAVLEVCVEFHRNQLLQAHEIDNPFD